MKFEVSDTAALAETPTMTRVLAAKWAYTTRRVPAPALATLAQGEAVRPRAGHSFSACARRGGLAAAVLEFFDGR